MTKFRTKYEHRHVGISFDGVVSLVDPQFADECSIEGIIKRYGILPKPDVIPLDADVSDIGDFAECMRRVQDGLDHFQSLPSDIRARFGNDPKAYYEWVVNPSNTAEAVRLGLKVERKITPTTDERLERIATALESTVTSKEGKQA